MDSWKNTLWSRNTVLKRHYRAAKGGRARQADTPQCFLINICGGCTDPSTFQCANYFTGTQSQKNASTVIVPLPDGNVLAQLGNQAQRRIQHLVFIVRHVGHDHDHEASRAAGVHASHYPILWTGRTNEWW